MCINVINGLADPKLPFYTKGGSFYINGTTRFLATLSEVEKKQTRNQCNRFGYESVALIPLIVEDRIIGLIHIADPRENMISLDIVEVLEVVGMQLGTAYTRIWAEETLIESKEKWRSLVENAPDIILTVNREGIITFINRVPEGMTVEKAIGTNVVDYVAPEYHETVKKSIQKVFETGENDFYEISARGPNDQKSWYSTCLGPIKRKGLVVAVMLITRDISESRQLQEEILEIVCFQ